MINFYFVVEKDLEHIYRVGETRNGVYEIDILSADDQTYVKTTYFPSERLEHDKDIVFSESFEYAQKLIMSCRQLWKLFFEIKDEYPHWSEYDCMAGAYRTFKANGGYKPKEINVSIH